MLAQVRATWAGHVVRRAFDDVISGLQPSWPDDDAERLLNADQRRLEYVVGARNACELYTQRLTNAIGSKVGLYQDSLKSSLSPRSVLVVSAVHTRGALRCAAASCGAARRCTHRGLGERTFRLLVDLMPCRRMKKNVLLGDDSDSPRASKHGSFNCICHVASVGSPIL